MKQKTAKRAATLILINLSAIAFILLLANLNFPIYPKEGMHTRDNKISFEWVGLGNAIIDDNPSLTSPIIVEKSKPVELVPGTYYWCVLFFNSCLGKSSFEIVSEVGISVTPGKIENETVYRVENQGNTRILLNIIHNIMGLTGRAVAVLEPNAVTYKNASGIEKIIASENE